jgi:hypothetical protein
MIFFLSLSTWWLPLGRYKKSGFVKMVRGFGRADMTSREPMYISFSDGESCSDSEKQVAETVKVFLVSQLHKSLSHRWNSPYRRKGREEKQFIGRCFTVR